MVTIALGFVLGAWCLQQQATLPSTYWLAVLPIILALTLFFHRQFFCHKSHQTRHHFLSFVLAALVGFLYAAGFASVRLNDELPKAWEREDVEVVGVVASLPKTNRRSERFRFDVEQVITPKAQVPNHIALSYYQANAWQAVVPAKQPDLATSTFKAGQRWRLTVRLKRPHTTYNPHGYDFEAWALSENSRATGYIRSQNRMQKITDFVWKPRTIIEYWRGKIGQRITQVLANQPYAGVVRALVIGDHSQIDAKNWEVYLHTGTNHLVSISGLHIGMLAGLAFSLVAFCWRRFPYLVLRIPTRKAAIIGGVCAALLYACLAGLSVPTQRTLTMLVAFALALLLNRRVAMSRALAIAVFVVVLFDPWAVISAGFWLSFSAVAFIAFSVTNRLKVRHWLVEAAHTQWAVTLGLLPFLIVMFGQASIVSPVANAFAIPIVSLLVVPLAIVGALLPLDFTLHAAQKILAICMHGLHWLAELPFAIWQQAAPPWWTMALAVLGVLWMLLPRGFSQRWLGLVLVLPMILVVPVKLAEGEMQVTVLDVGQGLSVVVKTATHVMLYDTGPTYNQEKNAGSSIVVPYLRSQGVKQLDMMVISHDDNDHSGGATSLLTSLPVSSLLSSYAFSESIKTKAIPTQSMCYTGQQWVWDGVLFEVLYPSQDSYQAPDIKDNNRSCVIKVTSHYGSMLLTGDIEKAAEEALLETHLHPDNKQTKLKSDIMIAPHHGSKTSSSHALIHAVDAKNIIFTVGYLNRFKHPKPAIMHRYVENDSALYRSDNDGAVLIDFTAQNSIQIKAWRSVRARYWHDKIL